jgi:hypothetical protein
MKKFALVLCFLCLIVTVKSQTTVAVLVDADTESNENIIKTSIELQLGLSRNVIFDRFPAKLQLSATVKPIVFQGKEIGFAVAYTYTEGIFYKRVPRLVLLGSGILTAPDTIEVVNILVNDFEKIIDQPRL